MASNHTTILVLGLTLGLVLLLILPFLLFVFVGYRNLQSELSSSKFSERALEQSLARYTEAGKRELVPLGRSIRLGDISTHDLRNAAEEYWFFRRDLGLATWGPDECPDTIDRIENIIFPKSRPLPLIYGEDFSLFPNPHHYSAAEIFKLLQNRVTRESIMCHIIGSVLDRYTTLTPVADVATYSLLPFSAIDIMDLYHLRCRLLGADWIGNLRGYIDRYPSTHRIHRAPGNPERQFIRSFIEELFGPYYGECSPEQIAMRNRSIERALDTAVEFGYLAACVAGEIVHVWGERQEGHTRLAPDLLYRYYAEDEHHNGNILVKGMVMERGL